MRKRERDRLEWDFCTSLVTTLSLFLASKECFCLGIFSNIYIPFITESFHSKHPKKNESISLIPSSFITDEMKWKYFTWKLSNSKKLLMFSFTAEILMSMKLLFFHCLTWITDNSGLNEIFHIYFKN